MIKRGFVVVLATLILMLSCSCATIQRNTDIGDEIAENICFDDIEKEKGLFNEIYVEGNTLAYFNVKGHYNTHDYDYDLYKLANYLSVCELIPNCDIKFVNEGLVENFCARFFDNNNFLDVEFDDMLDYMRIEHAYRIQEYRRLELQYVEEYINKILDADMAAKEKVLSINRLLRMSELLGEMPVACEQKLKNFLEDAIQEKNYFTYNADDLEVNVFTGGMVVIENCMIYNEMQTIGQIDVSAFKDWYNYWVLVYKDYLEAPSASLMVENTGIIRILRLNSIYSSSLDFETYLKFLSEIDWKERLSIDPKVVYEGLYILKSFGWDMPNLKDEVYNYAQFVYNFPPEVMLEEQYYGYEIATALGFQINEKLFLDTMKKQFETCESIKDAFYFMKIYVSIKGMEEFTDSYRTQYIEILSKSREELSPETSLEDMYYLLDTCKNMDPTKFQETEENIKNIAIDPEKISLEQDLYWHWKISVLEGNNRNWEYEALSENFYNGTGYMVVADRPDTENIYSTYRMLELKNSSDFRKSDLLCYRGSDGGYFVQRSQNDIKDYRDNFTLKSWLYGLVLNSKMSD